MASQINADQDSEVINGAKLTLHWHKTSSRPRGGKALHWLARLALRAGDVATLDTAMVGVRRCLDAVIFISRRDGRRAIEDVKPVTRASRSQELLDAATSLPQTNSDLR